jgi:hypothetical protein
MIPEIIRYMPETLETPGSLGITWSIGRMELIFITNCHDPIRMPEKKVALLPETGIQYTGDLLYGKDGSVV